MNPLQGQQYFVYHDATKGEPQMALVATRNLGLLCLAIYLIVTGLTGLVAVPVPGTVMAVLAILAGILLLFGR
jgi:hypothetical protein